MSGDISSLSRNLQKAVERQRLSMEQLTAPARKFGERLRASLGVDDIPVADLPAPVARIVPDDGSLMTSSPKIGPGDVRESYRAGGPERIVVDVTEALWY